MNGADIGAAAGDYETLDRCILCESLSIAPYDRLLRISRCGACGLLFDNPRPTVAAIERHYSSQEHYAQWAGLEGPIEALSRVRLRRVLRYKGGGDLLDIGAGMGHFLHVAQPYFRCIGTDLSAEACAFARRRYGLDLMHGEVEHLYFGHQRFDLITISHVLEHMPWPGRTLRRCRELLRPGGVLYLCTPNEAWYSLRRVLAWALGRMGVARFRPYRRLGLRRIDLGAVDEIHVSHFSEPVLRQGLAHAGFSVLGAGIDFHDAYMFGGPGVQILRRVLLAGAALIRAVARVNVYNCLWIAARPSTGRQSGTG